MHSLRKVLSLALTLSLLFQQIGFAQIATELNIASHLSRMASSLTVEKFRPAHLRYFSYDALTDNFKVLLDKGDQFSQNKENSSSVIASPAKAGRSNLQEQTQTLLNYFLVGVTLPDSMFWVNLRPDSEDQIIDQYLEKTDVGRIMLEADLQLKKDTSAMTSPATPEGKEYWDRLYKKAASLYGYDNVTIPTLTRPWIVPGEIIVRESKDSAYIYKATLKVMLEEDYLKKTENRRQITDYTFKDIRSKALNEYSTQLIKELIIPKLTKEVNSAKRYASLRQVYYSLILSRWFKQRFRGQKTENRGQKNAVIASEPQANEAISSRIDSKNLTNLISKDSWSKTDYFKQYQKSFSQGEYNIQEPVYTPTGQVIRSYFSGGMDLKGMPQNAYIAGSPISNEILDTGVLTTGNSTGIIEATTGSPVNPKELKRLETAITNVAGSISPEKRMEALERDLKGFPLTVLRAKKEEMESNTGNHNNDDALYSALCNIIADKEKPSSPNSNNLLGDGSIGTMLESATPATALDRDAMIAKIEELSKVSSFSLEEYKRSVARNPAIDKRTQAVHIQLLNEAIKNISNREKNKPKAFVGSPLENKSIQLTQEQRDRIEEAASKHNELIAQADKDLQIASGFSFRGAGFVETTRRSTLETLKQNAISFGANLGADLGLRPGDPLRDAMVKYFASLMQDRWVSWRVQLSIPELAQQELKKQLTTPESALRKWLLAQTFQDASSYVTRQKIKVLSSDRNTWFDQEIESKAHEKVSRYLTKEIIHQTALPVLDYMVWMVQKEGVKNLTKTLKELGASSAIAGASPQASGGEIVSSPISIEEAKKQLRQELGKVNIVSITMDKEAPVNLLGRYLNSIINENGISSYKYSHYSDRTSDPARPYIEISFSKQGQDVAVYYRSYEYADSLGHATLMHSGIINIANVFPAASSAINASDFIRSIDEIARSVRFDTIQIKTGEPKEKILAAIEDFNRNIRTIGGRDFYSLEGGVVYFPSDSYRPASADSYEEYLVRKAIEAKGVGNLTVADIMQEAGISNDSVRTALSDISSGRNSLVGYTITGQGRVTMYRKGGSSSPAAQAKDIGSPSLLREDLSKAKFEVMPFVFSRDEIPDKVFSIIEATLKNLEKDFRGILIERGDGRLSAIDKEPQGTLFIDKAKAITSLKEVLEEDYSKNQQFTFVWISTLSYSALEIRPKYPLATGSPVTLKETILAGKRDEDFSAGFTGTVQLELLTKDMSTGKRTPEYDQQGYVSVKDGNVVLQIGRESETWPVGFTHKSKALSPRKFNVIKLGKEDFYLRITQREIGYPDIPPIIPALKISWQPSAKNESAGSPIDRITKEEVEAWISSNIKIPERFELNTRADGFPKEFLFDKHKKRIQETVYPFLMSLPSSIEPEKFEFTFELSSVWVLTIIVRYGGQTKTNPLVFRFYPPYIEANMFDSAKLLAVENTIIEEIKRDFVYRIFGHFYGEPWKPIEEFIQISWNKTNDDSNLYLGKQYQGGLKPGSFLAKGSHTKEYGNDTPVVDFMELLDAWLRDGESAFSVPEAAPEETRKQAEQKLAFFKLYFNRDLSGSPLKNPEQASSALNNAELAKQFESDTELFEALTHIIEMRSFIQTFKEGTPEQRQAAASKSLPQLEDYLKLIDSRQKDFENKAPTSLMRVKIIFAFIHLEANMRGIIPYLKNPRPSAYFIISRLFLEVTQGAERLQRELEDFIDETKKSSGSPVTLEEAVEFLNSLPANWMRFQIKNEESFKVSERHDTGLADGIVYSVPPNKNVAGGYDFIIKNSVEPEQLLERVLDFMNQRNIVWSNKKEQKEIAEKITAKLSSLTGASSAVELKEGDKYSFSGKYGLLRGWEIKINKLFEDGSIEVMLVEPETETGKASIKNVVFRNKDDLQGFVRELSACELGTYQVEPLPLKVFTDFFRNAEDFAQRSSASPVIDGTQKKTGGIDFRSLPMTIQPMGSFSGLNFKLPKLSQAELARMDIDVELAQIQRMASSGILPSGERVKELIAACIQKQKINAYTDRLLLCLVNIFKLQEQDAVDSSPALREALVLVDAVS